MPTSTENLSNILPKHFSLDQNYPNPFNPSTSIQYAVSSMQFVSLKVYDLLGREVATLVNEEKPVGNYEVEFIGDGLTSGIYFYQLRAGNYVETKKMVLLR
ncbi:MAG: T9SS type A sorting domain-containing protein [Bacteroidetes bacterium]|nr:T9SS type A sorting domain-containing protein [Bacteroidota bacterium]